MDGERLQNLRERAAEAIRLGERIEEIGKVGSGSVANLLFRSYGSIEQSDLQQIWTLGKYAFIETLEKQLESLIAVEPEPTVNEVAS